MTKWMEGLVVFVFLLLLLVLIYSPLEETVSHTKTITSGVIPLSAASPSPTTSCSATSSSATCSSATISSAASSSAASSSAILESLLEILSDDFHTHVEDYIQIEPDTYRVEEVMAIEDQNHLVDCPSNIHGYNSTSPSFHCIHFNDTEQYPTKEIRTVWFNDYCAPWIDININTRTTIRTSRTRCSLYKFNEGERERIQEYVNDPLARHHTSLQGLDNDEIWLCVPNIFLLSHPKVGSTSVFDTLVSHPNIQKINIFFKEPSFFSDPGIKIGMLTSDLLIYLWTQCPSSEMVSEEMKEEAIARAAVDGSVPTICSPIQCGDYSTHYTYRTNAMHNMRAISKVFPDAKIITIMREPMARQISEMNMELHHKSVETLSEWIDIGIRGLSPRVCRSANRTDVQLEECQKPRAIKNMEEINRNFFPFSEFALLEHLVVEDFQDFAMHTFQNSASFGKGMYWLQLRMIEDIFPEKNHFVGFGEDFFDLSTRYKANHDVFSFIGVDPDYVSPLTHSNAAKHSVFTWEDFDEDLVKGITDILASHTQHLMQQYHIPKESFPQGWKYLLND